MIAALLLCSSPVTAYIAQGPRLPTAAVPMLASPRAMPLCQFGTGNFDESKTKKSFVLSPIPGISKVRNDPRTGQPNNRPVSTSHS